MNGVGNYLTRLRRRRSVVGDGIQQSLRLGINEVSTSLLVGWHGLPPSSNDGLQRIACYSFGRSRSVVSVKGFGVSESVTSAARDR